MGCFNEEIELDLHYSAVEKKVLALVDYQRDQGRKEPMKDDLAERLDLDPDVKLTKKDLTKTGVKFTKPHTNKVLEAAKEPKAPPAPATKKKPSTPSSTQSKLPGPKRT